MAIKSHCRAELERDSTLRSMDPEPWSDADRRLLRSTFGIMAVDAKQTMTIVTDDDYRERNPVIDELAEHSTLLVPAYFIALGGIYYLIADKLKEEYRKPFLSIVGMLHLGAVINNFSIGVGF